MSNYGSGLTKEQVDYMEYVNACISACTNRKTIWKLYGLAPSNARFTLQIVKEDSDEVIDMVSFRKDVEGEKKAGENALRILIRKISHIHGDGYPHPRVISEFEYNFNIRYTVKVYV